MKKVFSLGALALAGVLAFTGCSCNNDKEKTEDTLPALPAARLAQTTQGAKCYYRSFEKGCTSVNASNLYQYMGRSDVEYIDLREYTDYAARHFEGFKLVPYNTEITAMFGGDKGVTPKNPRALQYLEDNFPKDKALFIICAGGTRVAKIMEILDANGWDMSKVYNIGGMSDYTTEKVENYDSLYKKYVVTSTATANDDYTYYTGTADDGSGGHVTTVKLTVDANQKIKTIYVTGDDYYTRTAATGWNPETWESKSRAYINGLIGKNLQDITTMLGSGNAASGADVVTGATEVSNRILKAVKAALESINA